MLSPSPPDATPDVAPDTAHGAADETGRVDRTTGEWLDRVPVLVDFAASADPALYLPLPDDWVVGVADVVDSTGAIAAGRYKAVNLAGVGCVSAVANALGGRLALFVFLGDGAAFAVAPDEAPVAADALARVAGWARRELGLELRVGTVPAADARAAGLDVRAAFWRASEHVHYAMFAGGGIEWAEARLKAGNLGPTPRPADAGASLATPDPAAPDLTGLTCSWGPVRAVRGRILSLIVKPAPGASMPRFATVARQVILALERAASLGPVPAEGPPTHWPSGDQVLLQGRIGAAGRPRWARAGGHLVSLALVWLVFRLNLRLGRFDPRRYRRELAANTDFRKFSDGLMMTVDCPPRAAARLRAILKRAAREGVVRYGLHLQDEALVTCFVPSVLTPDHMHFIDGAGGGYAAAAGELRAPPAAASGLSGGC